MTVETSSQDGPARSVLKSQALLVLAGPYRGRIGFNDDDELMFREDFSLTELSWMEKEGIAWREIKIAPEELGEEFEIEDPRAVDCEVITFGHFLQCDHRHYIPQQFLRPATMKELVQRHQEIDAHLVNAALLQEGPARRPSVRIDLLLEQAYIADEIWRCESLAMDSSEPRKLFLCHASADKPFVRQVRNDLANAGHSIWMDEFEIAVGDSIVQKINQATATADALILFVSQASAASDWVAREWNSALARMLSGASVRVLPAMIEECEVPAILADIKYADFRESYSRGLADLLSALKGLKSESKEH